MSAVNTVPTTVQLTAELHELLRRLAYERKTSASALIRDAIARTYGEAR